MKRLIWASLLSVCAQLLSAQESFYIKVDPSCMDRMEYHINGASKGVEYISYRVRQGDKNFVFLEVGSESSGFQLSAPDLVDCRRMVYSDKFIEKVNKGDINVFIVRKSEIGYNISPVHLATTQNFTGRVLKYTSFDTEFQADVVNATSDVNLTNSDANNEIFIGGNGGNQCLKEYYFHKVSKETCRPAVGLVFIPEIGVVKEITGKSQLSDNESTLSLVRINDVSMETYIKNICDASQEKILLNEQYTINDIETVEPSSSITQTISQENTSIATAESTSEVFTTRGEAVEKVIETTPISYDAPAKKIARTVKKITNTQAEIAIASDEIVANTAKLAIKCIDEANSEVHVVQQGETLYGIARKYGLTVEQLQSWNNMDNSSISPCSKLRISPATIVEKKAIVPSSYDTEKSTLLTKSASIEVAEIAAWKNLTSKIHVVEKGDTYYALAKKHGYTVERLLEMNGITDENGIEIGQKLQVNDCVCPIEKATTPVSYSMLSAKQVKAEILTEILTEKGAMPTTTKKPDDKKKEAAKTLAISYKRQTVHIVQEDETLQTVAKKYGLTMEQLTAINYVEKSEVLIPNQRLFVD